VCPRSSTTTSTSGRWSLPLATGRLRIVPSRLGDEAGIIGAAGMVLETILAPAAVDAALVGAGRA
jgi:hypothetical protein